jgi:flagellar biosynthesis protein FliP
VTREKYSLIFSCFLFVLFSGAAWQAYHFVELARFFPFYISIVAAIVSLGEMLLIIRKIKKRKGEAENSLEDSKQSGSVVKYMIWIVAYIVIIIVLGFLPATVLFLFAFLYFETKFSLVKSLLSVAITMTVITIIANIMTLYWPKGIVHWIM